MEIYKLIYFSGLCTILVYVINMLLIDICMKKIPYQAFEDRYIFFIPFYFIKYLKRAKSQSIKIPTHPNCLEYALHFWEEHFEYKIYYNSDHVITLPKSYVKLDNYLPIEEYGLDHMLNSFTLDDRSIYLLHKYFNYSRVKNN